MSRRPTLYVFDSTGVLDETSDWSSLTSHIILVVDLLDPGLAKRWVPERIYSSV